MDLRVVHGISTVLIVLICLISIGSLLWAVKRQREAVSFFTEVDGLLRDLKPEDFYDARAGLIRGLDQKSDVVRAAWREFDESLVSDDDQRRVWNTVEAEQFFNERRFAPKLFGNRLLDAVPTILTTLGLIGTFSGLAVGLRAISLDGSTDEMTHGIQQLVAGAEVGFLASLIGVAASLITNFLLKTLEFAIVKRAHRLQDTVDGLFELRSPEHSLSTIAKHSAESAAALAELHEKIGTRLQEAVGGIAESTRAAVTESIHESLAPVMQDLASRAADQSAEVFEKIGAQMTAAFRQLSTTVADELTKAAQGMTSTLDYMASKLATQADQYREQMAELQAATARQVELLEEKLPAVIESIDQASARIGTATEQFEVSSEHLSTTATAFRETSDRFNETLVSSAETFDRIAARNDEASSALESLAEKMVGLTDSTSEATVSLRESATALSDGFATMREHQETFLADLDARLTRQLDVVTTSLGDQAERMSQWLADYSAKVSEQTQKRMDDWNQQTLAFTNGMIQAVGSLNAAIEELDDRVARPVRTPHPDPSEPVEADAA